jgi:glycosyltransferase involved in cell wall biosynthesis
MRVALLGAGEAIHTQRWAKALADRDLDVRLFSLERAPEELLKIRNLSIVQLPSRPLPGFLRYPLASTTLRRELDRFDPQLIDSHFVHNYGLLGAMSGRRPLVVSCWGSDLLLTRDPLRRMRARWVLDRADRVFVDGKNLARTARGLGVGDDRLRLVFWGVDTGRFAFSADGEERRRHRQSWPEAWRRVTSLDGPVVVSTRTLEPVYDVATLIRAWPAVVRQIPRARCLVVGEGGQRAPLQNLARANGAEQTLTFLGRLTHHEDLSRLLSGADVYVSTSLSDSTSVSLLEAMSTGCYPVVSNIEGNLDWVDEERARIFRVGDEEDLGRALVGALEAGEQSVARRQNRRRIETQADWTSTIDRVVREFRQLVGS